MKKHFIFCLTGLAAATALAGSGFAATVPAGTSPQSLLQTRFVSHLEELNLQPLVQQAAADHAKGPEAGLFRSAEIFTQWGSYASHPEEQFKLGQEFVGDVQAYFKASGAAVDANWALNQAKFIFANIVPPLSDKIEYWSGTPKDMAALQPVAQLAHDLLKLADAKFAGTVTRLNNAVHFTDADEQVYMTAMNGQTQTGYYQAYGDYFLAISLPAAAPQRSKLLDQSIKLLQHWINSGPQSGVLYQSLLLSGKANLQNGKYGQAISDLTKAQASGAPLWVQYQAKYQQIVAILRSGDLKAAAASQASYSQWIRANKSIDVPSARMGAELLRYRILARDKTQQQAATQLVLTIVSKAPQYQDLIYQHLAGGLTGKPNFAALEPIKTLAYAWLQAHHRNNAQSLDAVNYLLADKAVPPDIRREALLIGGICNGRLGRLDQSVTMDLGFIEAKPTDPRAKNVLDVALYHLRQLNQGGGSTPGLSALTLKALDLAYNTFHEKKWALPYATQLEKAKQLAEAQKVLKTVPRTDKLYLLAHYQLVRIATIELGNLVDEKKSSTQQRQAALNLMQQCQSFLASLDQPPPGTPPDVIKEVQGYRQDIWLIQASTALDPLQDPSAAGRALNKLDSIRKSLSPRLQGVVLRYRIRQYQLSNEPQKILPLVKQYADQSSQSADDVIRGLIGQYDSESRRIQKTDPVKAQSMANDAAALLNQLIAYLQSKPGTKPDEIYTYQQIYADELVRAGHPHQAMALYKQLEGQKPQDLRNFLGVARCAYETADYSYSHSLYVRTIPKLTPGSELFWGAYIYLIRGNLRANTHRSATTQSLAQLYAIYGDQIGGKYYHSQFMQLLNTYGVSISSH